MTQPKGVPTGVGEPRCRVCAVDRAPGRQPNRATHLTVYIDGMTTLTCGRHALLAARGGGFAIELTTVDGLVTAPLSTAELVEKLRVASSARGDHWKSRPLRAESRPG